MPLYVARPLLKADCYLQNVRGGAIALGHPLGKFFTYRIQGSVNLKFRRCHWRETNRYRSK